MCNLRSDKRWHHFQVCIIIIMFLSQFISLNIFWLLYYTFLNCHHFFIMSSLIIVNIAISNVLGNKNRNHFFCTSNEIEKKKHFFLQRNCERSRKKNWKWSKNRVRNLQFEFLAIIPMKIAMHLLLGLLLLVFSFFSFVSLCKVNLSRQTGHF